MGNFISQENEDMEHDMYDTDDDESSEGEDGVRLEEVSSDVEVEEARFGFEDDSEDDDAE